MATKRTGTGHAFHASAHRSNAPATVAPQATVPGFVDGGAINAGGYGGLTFVPSSGEPAGFGFALQTDDYGFAAGDDLNPLNGSGFDADVGSIDAQTYGGTGGAVATQSGDVSGSPAYANAKRKRFHTIATAGSIDPAAPAYTGRSPKRRALSNATWWSKATPLEKYGLIAAGFVAVSVAVLLWHKAHGGKVRTTVAGHATNTARGIHRAIFGG